MRILFVSTGLGVGGAEMMLVALGKALVARGHAVHVIGLKSPVGVTERLRESGCSVEAWDLLRIRDLVAMPWRLFRTIRTFRPDLIQGWMYQGCLVASAAGFMTGRPAAWSLHHSNFDPRYNGRGTLASIRLAAWVSRREAPEGIAYCGPNSRDAHHRFGFAEEPASILPNGVDFEKFRPDVESRCHIRRELGVDETTVLIGIFANRVPIKDHATFFAAAGRLAALYPEVRFVCCGGGMSADSKELADETASVGCSGKVFFLGRRDDVPAVMNACDIVTLTSRGESFPMALTEAVACGIPVISTDVGDCAWVVGEPARLFLPGDVPGLVSRWSALLSAGADARREVGSANRARTRELFSLDKVTDVYEAFAAGAVSLRGARHA